MNTLSRPPRRQRGLLTILITIAFLLILGFAALAIDVNHMVASKAKLQNAVDAAALAAVEQAYLSPTNKETNARGAVTDLFDRYYAQNGNKTFPLPDYTNETNGDLFVQFGNVTKDDELTFSGTIAVPDEVFVRVSIFNYELESYFLSLIGTKKVVNATAVAGLVAVYTATVPITVCAIDPTDLNDPEDPDDSVYGFEKSKAYALKLQAAGELMQAGNFQLLDTGKQGMAEAMASGCDVCQVENGDYLLSEPGNSVGPVGEGLNTRFGDFNGSMKKYEGEPGFEDDDYVNEISEFYNLEYLEEFETTEEYKDAVTVKKQDGTEVDKPDFFTNYYQEKGNYRRMVFVPVIECPLGEDAPKAGKSSYLKLNDLCFLLLQRAPTSSGDKTPIIGEFREECPSGAGAIAEDGDLTGPVRAVLLKDPDNEDT